MKKTLAILMLVVVFQGTLASIYTMERGSSLHLRCPNTDEHTGSGAVNAEQVVMKGRPGKMGPQGPPGPPGIKEPDSELRKRYEDRIAKLESELSGHKFRADKAGTITNPGSSCKEIRKIVENAKNGLYYIKDNEENVFLTYCDMVTDSGGWTLVASVHENNMKGRCTSGDRWSSEQGNSADHPHGDGFWENRAIHGAASSATSDDYKNSGYFAMNAVDIMVWHVPNDTPMRSYEKESLLKYHTTNGFLQTYGGNLHSLYSKHYPMRSKKYLGYTDNGPAIPIIWIKGNNARMIQLIAPNSRTEIDPGYIQFRAINHERNAFALCTGVRIKKDKKNVEHVCVGSTSFNIGHGNEEDYCGDFAAKDWSHSPGWQAPAEMINAAVLLFYR